MGKVVKLSESDLSKIIKKVISEHDYSSYVTRQTSDRERQVKSIFGDKYGSYIPNDVLRYIRKNPAQFFKKIYEMYGDKAYDYLDNAKNKGEN